MKQFGLRQFGASVAAVFPTAPQVQTGVTFGPTGADFTGTLSGGGVGIGARLYDMGNDHEYIVITARTIERL